MEETYFNPDEVGVMLGITAPTVRGLANTGRIASIRLGRRMLFSMEAVNKFLNSLGIQHNIGQKKKIQ